MRYIFIFLMIVMQSSSMLCDAKKKQEAVDTLKILSLRGDSCIAAYNYYHASVFYKQAYDLNSNVTMARKLANVYRKMGRNKDCASLLRSIPSDSIVYNDIRSLYFAYSSMSNRDSLLFYGDSATHLNPYDSEIVVSMASYCNDNNKPLQAGKICSLYLLRDSTNLLVLRQYGYSSYLLEDYSEAYKTYKKLEEKGFDNYESTFIMGISLAKLHKNELAYDYLLRAATHKSFKDYISLHYLGTLCLEIGKNDEAVIYLSQAIELQKPDSSLLAILYKEKAQAYYNKQNYYKAAKEFEQSAIYNPDDPITYYNIAQMYGATGDKKKEKANYTIFLQKSDLLKDTEENRELIKRVKKGLTRNSLC